MKKSKIYLAIGASIIAITGVLATKANKQFTQVTSATATFPAGYALSGSITLPAAHFTTVSNGCPVYIGLFTLCSNPGCPTMIVSVNIKAAASLIFHY